MCDGFARCMGLHIRFDDSEAWIVASDGCIGVPAAYRREQYSKIWQGEIGKALRRKAQEPRDRAVDSVKAKRSKRPKTGRRRGPLPTMAVANRDGWVCHLCGKDIDRERRHWAGNPDPLALSIDHVIPWSKGGTDDLDNLRAAHWRCNVSRGNADLPAVAHG